MSRTKMVYECSEFIKTAAAGAPDFDELIVILEDQVEWLKDKQTAGITMETPIHHDGCFEFTTDDAMVAKKFDMERCRREAIYATSATIKIVGANADDFDELIVILEDQVERLKAMKAAGVTMEPWGGGWFQFTTDDVKLAKNFDMEREDYWDEKEAPTNAAH